MAPRKTDAERAFEIFSTGPRVDTPFTVWLVGDSPLIVHAWSQKAKIDMLTKQKKTTKAGRDERDPDADFTNSLYPMRVEHGEPVYGFPATGIKNSVLSVAHKDKGLARTDLMASLFIRADLYETMTAKAGATCNMPLVRIWAPQPKMREDMVRVGVGLNKKASLAYRAEFWPWAIHISGYLNTKTVPRESLGFMFSEAGKACGIGEWRNEKRGPFGEYHPATQQEAKLWGAFSRGVGPLPPPPNTAFTLAAE